ncbi:MAG: SpoIIE family protein phosphatase [Chloroflexi bacterium]|nr:SpoIIE family protein phosphatase [Chloroflexota bacterium]MCI0577597.1 SpoIIE family protein phosphatase [Chloroflexota bacterium]MCI0644183.1 SpoIIE family protein phosphatase [Chloroflexota bacterium]MCI0725234.1 SpoIIE family protein phosphatase [Chloroflexota bacterium]
MDALTIPGTVAALGEVTNYVLAAAAAAGLDEKMSYRLRLAVDEIATNVVTHGYAEAGLSGTLTIWADQDEKHLTVYLEDSGVTYDPHQALPENGPRPSLEEPPVGGLGAFLALAGVNQFHYQQIQGRNRSTFVVRRMEPTGDHLLLVDKDELRLNALARWLEEWGPAVSTATGKAHALALLAAWRFDAVLIDLAVASQNDFALLRRLQSEAEGRQGPVIVLASPVEEIEISRCIELGVVDYLHYPLDLALLKLRLQAHLARRDLQTEAASARLALDEMKHLADQLRLVILPLGIALSAEKEFDRLLERIVVEAKRICKADAGTLYLRAADDHLHFTITQTDSLGVAYGGTTGRPVPYSPLPLYDENGAPNYHNVATYVAHHGRTVNIPDVYQAPGFDFSGTRVFDQANGYRSISCLTVPLKRHDVIGVLQLLNARDPGHDLTIPFSEYHQLVAESLASQAAIVLHNHILRQRQEELQEFGRELEIARQIQASFLPVELPRPPGWEIAVRFRPARVVAGDFYDVFATSGGRIGLVVADVCGKGVGAALFMALVRSLLRAFAQRLENQPRSGPPASISDSEPDRPVLSETADALLDTISLTNLYLVRNHLQTNMFATLFFGVLDPSTGYLSYVNGGHNPPAVLNGGQVRLRLAPTGPAVGLRADARFEVGEAHLAPADVLLVYTDGLTEARDPHGVMLTEKRFLSLIPAQLESAGALLDHVESVVQAHVSVAGQYDDITILAVKRAG